MLNSEYWSAKNLRNLNTFLPFTVLAKNYFLRTEIKIFEARLTPKLLY